LCDFVLALAFTLLFLIFFNVHVLQFLLHFLRKGNILQTLKNELALGEKHLFWPQLLKQLQSLEVLAAKIKVFGIFF
jgi:hypothetical protein